MQSSRSRHIKLRLSISCIKFHEIYSYTNVLVLDDILMITLPSSSVRNTLLNQVSYLIFPSFFKSFFRASLQFSVSSRSLISLINSDVFACSFSSISTISSVVFVKEISFTLHLGHLEKVYLSLKTSVTNELLNEIFHSSSKYWF